MDSKEKTEVDISISNWDTYTPVGLTHALEFLMDTNNFLKPKYIKWFSMRRKTEILAQSRN